MAGVGDKIAGKAKQAQGKLTGDKAREAEGKAQASRGTLKQKGQSAKDKVQGTVRAGRSGVTGSGDKAAGRSQRAKEGVES